MTIPQSRMALLNFDQRLAQSWIAAVVSFSILGVAGASRAAATPLAKPTEEHSIITAPMPQQPKYKKREMKDASGKPLSIVDFDEAAISGKAKAPDGYVLRSKENGGGFQNLIELRRNFRGQARSSYGSAMMVSPIAP